MKRILHERYYSFWGLTRGSKGIRRWPINWCTSPMVIHEITPSEDYNKWMECQTLTLMNQPIKIPKVVKPLYNKTFRNSVINSSMSPPSLGLTNSSSIITSQEVYLSINAALHPFTLTVSISCVSTDNVSYIIIHRLQPHGCQIF